MNIRHISIALCLLTVLPVCGRIKIKVKSKAPQAAYAASLLGVLDGDYVITIDIADTGEAEGFTLKH